MTSNWATVALGDVLAPVRRVISPVPDSKYMLVTLPLYGKGARLRKAVLGSELGTARYRVQTGDLMISKIDARKGSNSLLPAELDGAVVTGDFLSYEIDKDLIQIEFMDLVAKSTWFSELCDSVSSGTTNRVRLDVSRFLELKIQLPPLTEQHRIVDLIGSLDDAIEAADDMALRAREAYGGIVQGLARDAELIPVGSVLKTAKSGGTPSRQKPEYFGGAIPWIKSGEVDQDSINSSEEHITEAALAASAAWIVPAGATLVAMYGQGNTKGTAGLVTIPVATNQAVLALVPDEDRILPTYLLHAVRSRTRSLRSKAVGAAQPNLSKRIIVEEPIPLPDLEQQSIVSSACSALQDVAFRAKAQTDSLRKLRSELLTSLLSGAHTIPESYDEVMTEAEELVTA